MTRDNGLALKFDKYGLAKYSPAMDEQQRIVVGIQRRCARQYNRLSAVDRKEPQWRGHWQVEAFLEMKVLAENYLINGWSLDMFFDRMGQLTGDFTRRFVTT
jgi:hypothetical protein